jgi:uncharacterized protein (TIGR00369 family)
MDSILPGGGLLTDAKLDDDHFCFACGPRNPDGLHLSFEYPEPGRCRAVFTPERRFQGWAGLLHGGIISTLLDEALAHALGGPDRGGGEAAVTGELSVRFKKPVPIGIPAVLEGRVVAINGRIIEGESRLLARDGSELAVARGKLFRLKKG